MEKNEIQAGHYQLNFSAEPEPKSLSANIADTTTDGIYEIEFCMKFDTPASRPNLKIEWIHPMVDTHLRWLTRTSGATAIMPWPSASRVSAKGTSQAPVYGLLSIDGTNQLTFAISDAVNNTSLQAKLSEEEAVLYCNAEIPPRTKPELTEHKIKLLMDTRKVTYAESLAVVSKWWEEMPEYKPMPVSDNARLPMYSTWYSFHQDITEKGIENQCRLGKEIGMDSVIVDDGWQTDDNSRGYAYCGDWEAVTSKFPDFPAHVKRVQDMGVKYLLWFSVPFVGINSKAYNKFKDCLLPAKPESKWFCLDPRCDEVRKYLIDIYEYFVRDCGVDGLKLDFVDAFGDPAPEDDKGKGAQKDISVAEAAVSLLGEISDRLQKIKPDIMLEFRQSYIGPAMRRCGNIFRVGDVPNDFPSNRIHSIDLRLLSGNTAVHSDMIMWHPDDSVESAALQLLHTLFAVPQISVLIDQIPENHRQMLKTYLNFWRENRELLLDNPIIPKEPGMLYPQVQVASDSKWLSAVYGNAIVNMPQAMPDEILLINGTLNDKIFVSIPDNTDLKCKLRVFDCLGNCCREENILLSQGLHEIAVPPAGIARLQA